ncbi:hypothetical protein NVP3058O_007 [Vibrio phage 3.058.O._10N.286.46.B8]|uniref:hypothetical protein n=1 Tax=Vibrio phage henriette 12B8 TaxID=573174 RepID=UPI0002C05C8A|nr:hypothetical protein VPDG_00135 [Vibrio phage henriette 12B8]AGG58296.1 hypothetical protein VPDG_00135 [Vibrio phage henriette 12B8]AUS01925.1 hypothetical protein NVP2058O_008 [Vibrio phage 2.058.O._10N.286.46.B8]AUS03077.1 hypothetical protein NVP3058O_007 [Vibrio phage 3.058.O._10N.286.46.B8]
MSKGFSTSVPGRAWSGDANAMMERLTAMIDTPASASKSEWQAIWRGIAEVAQGTDPTTFQSDATYRAALVTALTV